MTEIIFYIASFKMKLKTKANKTQFPLHIFYLISDLSR